MDLTMKSLIRVLAGGALVLDKTLNAKNTNVKNTELFQDGRKNLAAEQKALEDETWKRFLQQKEADDKADLVKSRKERDAFNKVQKYGGEWKTVDLMNTALQSFGTESEKKKAIIDNLRYHKLVLKTQPSNSKLFTITANGRAKTLDVLKENLRALITLVQESGNEENDEENDEY